MDGARIATSAEGPLAGLLPPLPSAEQVSAVITFCQDGDRWYVEGASLERLTEDQLDALIRAVRDLTDGL